MLSKVEQKGEIPLLPSYPRNEHLTAMGYLSPLGQFSVFFGDFFFFSSLGHDLLQNNLKTTPLAAHHGHFLRQSFATRPPPSATPPPKPPQVSTTSLIHGSFKTSATDAPAQDVAVAALLSMALDRQHLNKSSSDVSVVHPAGQKSDRNWGFESRHGRIE